MEVRYVAVYELRGANGLSSDTPSILFEGENPNVGKSLLRSGQVVVIQ
jgi:hypothetical protein